MDRDCLPERDEAVGGGEEQPQTPKKKKIKMKNKRRFSDEQIRLLESIFESETKLEPRKKLQVAGELGLQPRQVAIWFQNRRARWKSKQIEKEYRVLRAKYDSLASKFESLKKEKQSLILQLQNLSELLAEPHGMKKAIGGGSEDGETRYEAEAEARGQQNFQQTELENRGLLGLQIGNDRDNSNIIEQTGQPSDEFLSMEEDKNNENPAASPEKLYGFDSVGLFDHSCSNPQWLNFWI